MTLTPLLLKKLDEYKKHCIIALDFFYKYDFEHALGDFRKSGEALMKALILHHFRDVNGEKIILGELNDTLTTLSPPKKMEYQDLLNIVKNKKLLPMDIGRLKDLQKKGNISQHNPNTPTNFHVDAELCKSQSFQLTSTLYKKLNYQIPQELENSYTGQINKALITDITNSGWNDLLQYVDNFSKLNKYILIAPPTLEGCTAQQKEVLARINWSFVLDFDSKSKVDGLFKAFENTKKSSFIPLTLRQKGQKNIVSEGSHRNINWLFANGLNTVPETVSQNIRNWRSLKYHLFIKELFSDFFSKGINRYMVIYLWDDLNYVEEITRIISEIEELPPDLMKHVFISKNSDTIDKTDGLDKYGINFKTFNLSHQDIVSGIINVIDKPELETDKILIPARTKSEENAIVDISDIYTKLLDNHITVVYQNIEQGVPNKLDDNIPTFYQGEQITWRELSIDTEVKRNKYDELELKIGSHLRSAKKSMKFELFHKPGAGGTTLAIKIAYDLRHIFPTIIITHFDKISTYRSLLQFMDRVNRPALAVVEASNIALNDLDDLIRNCNSNKLIVCFLYVRRALQNVKSGEFSVFVNDAMGDINERDKFLAKSNLYAKDKKVLEELQHRQAIECEVIDFSLAINEKEYNNTKLIDYINEYVSKMPENQIRFTAYTSLIYYYSQKNVSELVFRSLFKKGLTEELKQTAGDKQYIRKILIQEFDQHKFIYTDYWRPRFSKFAEMVLKVVLGGKNVENWKEQINIYALDFIRVFKENNEYLVDETRGILKGIFFERNNEDLLGTEEQWKSAVDNDQFSFLLRDIGNKQKQKVILTMLVEEYPSETHFLGHLARFLYEKAEVEAEFEESEKYLLKAFEYSEASKDFNLQHIGGMNKRRHIEFLKRRHSHGPDIIFDESIIKGLSDDANLYFNKSRTINPYNVHAYVAQIQTLITVIDFGRELSGIDRKELFITNPKYSWYLDQYETVIRLIDEAQILIEQQETLGKTSKIMKAHNYISASEGKSYELLGKYGISTEMFKNLIETSDRGYRPQLRVMYIKSLLLGKVKGDKMKIDSAWALLKSEEVQNVAKLIDDNILQDSGNIFTLRLWFKLVRYSSINVPLDEIIARLKIWYDQSESFKILHLEAAYYLYVLHSCLAIRSGDSISTVHKNEANIYIKKCRELSHSSKYPFEYYTDGKEIACIINHRKKGPDNSILERVEGTITLITSRQQGKITLMCGLEAFFVPYLGSFVQGTDETTNVSFYLGFRHDGLFAIEVRPVNQLTLEEGPVEPISELRREVEEPEDIEDIEILDPAPAPIEKYKIQGPKIVGYIDPSKLVSPNKKKKK